MKRNIPLRRRPGGRYGVRKVVGFDGRVYDSQLEKDRWAELCLLQKAGAISQLELKPRLRLTKAQIGYTPDYGYIQDGRQVFEDAKGPRTARFDLIKQLWPVYGPALLRITKRNRYGKIVTAKQIMGKAET